MLPSLDSSVASVPLRHLAFDGLRADGPPLRISLGPVSKSAANPLFGESQPWDAAWWNTYPSVAWDGAAGLYKMWYNSNVDCGGGGGGGGGGVLRGGASCPSTAYAFPPQMVHQAKARRSATLYAEAAAPEGPWRRPALGLVPWPIDDAPNATNTANNLVFSSGGSDPNRGVFLDAHAANASRRFKAFGSFDRAADAWKPAGSSSLGTLVSADGKAWGGYVPADEVDAPADTANQVLWDDSWDDSWDEADGGGEEEEEEGQGQGRGRGRYVLFTRTHCTSSACNESGWGLRRESRSVGVGPGWAEGGAAHAGRNWQPAVEVAHGEHGYELYSIAPWRSPAWRPGLLLAVGSYFASADAARQGQVYCELMSSGDHGASWTRLAPHQPFIPLGGNGTFDSHTCYAANPIADPRNASGRVLLFYAGGNGPHSGPRANSMALATAPADALVGLRVRAAAAGGGGDGGGGPAAAAAAAAAVPAEVTAVRTTRRHSWGSDEALHVLVGRAATAHESGAGGTGCCVRVRVVAMGEAGEEGTHVRAEMPLPGGREPQWVVVPPLPPPRQGGAELRLELSGTDDVVLYAFEFRRPE